MCPCMCISEVGGSGDDPSIYMYTHTHTHTHTGPSSDLHWDSRDQHHVATAVSQRVRLPCYHHPQGLHQGNDPTSNQHTHTRAHCPPTPPPTGSLASWRYQVEHEVFGGQKSTHLLEPADDRQTSLRGSSRACGCRTETCSQEMSRRKCYDSSFIQPSAEQ